MKKIFKMMAFAIIALVAMSCSQGATAIEKAYEEACGAAPAEKIATTLTNGHIKVETLTTEEYAKLGAIIEYLTYNGMYSSNFEAQVDMHDFGALLRAYRQHQQTPSERLQIDQLTRELLLKNPGTGAAE